MRLPLAALRPRRHRPRKTPALTIAASLVALSLASVISLPASTHQVLQVVGVTADTSFDEMPFELRSQCQDEFGPTSRACTTREFMATVTMPFDLNHTTGWLIDATNDLGCEANGMAPIGDTLTGGVNCTDLFASPRPAICCAALPVPEPGVPIGLLGGAWLLRVLGRSGT